MPAGEFHEALAGFAPGEINLKDMFQQTRQLIERHTLEHFASNRLLVSETASHHHMIPFHCFTPLLPFCAEQADVSHVVLRTGVRASGQMNIYRTIKLQLFFQMARKKNCLTLCVGSRPLAPGIPSAGYQTTRDTRCLVMKAHPDKVLLYRL